jgi:hypothetical protein
MNKRRIEFALGLLLFLTPLALRAETTAKKYSVKVITCAPGEDNKWEHEGKCPKRSCPGYYGKGAGANGCQTLCVYENLSAKQRKNMGCMEAAFVNTEENYTKILQRTETMEESLNSGNLKLQPKEWNSSMKKGFRNFADDVDPYANGRGNESGQRYPASSGRSSAAN